MNRSDLVNIWTLTLHMNIAAPYGDRKELDGKVQDSMDWLFRTEPVMPPFIWKKQGVILTVRTTGNPDVLIEIGQWALDNMASPGPTGFELSRSLSAPLRLTEGWKGYDGN